MEARSILAIVIAAIAAISPATSQSKLPIKYSLTDECQGVFEGLVKGEIADECRRNFPDDKDDFHQCSKISCAFLKCDDVTKCANTDDPQAVPAVTYECSKEYGLNLTQHESCCSLGCS